MMVVMILVMNADDDGDVEYVGDNSENLIVTIYRCL